ncbi:hypothetical protein BGX28_009413 [Mortierella sp. GBA30]|nr:hypothetical protein BGX28_009413 [Mortierella sp. GBA30]
MSTSPSSPSSKSPTSPRVVKRKFSGAELSKPNESWFLILVNAFKSNFEQTLTYRESELYAWIMQAYPYYRHDMHTMHTSVKKTLSSYECFRQNGRSTWTFIPTRALVHLKNLKSDDGRDDSDSLEEDEDEHDLEAEDEVILDQSPAEGSSQGRYSHQQQYGQSDQYQDGSDCRLEGPTDTSIRYVDRKVDLMDENTPTLSVEEIQRFKQEHSGAQARKLKRKASGGHGGRPRTKSPPAGLQDECSMSMEAWCNLLVQMFEASPKQKTIREIYAWVHDNYPIYQNAPGDEWQADLTAALESNPLFRAMGRGRWQMATQPVQPIVIVNGSVAPSGNGSTTNPSIKSDEDATDSPSVTEDEDWKAIGSKRLLNFSFRRYSIATDTFPKSHYKVGSTVPASSSPQSGSASGSAVAMSATSGSSSLTATTLGGKLLPLDPRSVNYTTGRRFSSYHQPTPKNSPPLSATTVGLPSVEEFSLQLKTALSEETDDEEEDPARRYMAPLQSAINSAVLALQTQQSQQRNHEQATPLSTTSPYSQQHHPIHIDLSAQPGTVAPPITIQQGTPTNGASSSSIKPDDNISQYPSHEHFPYDPQIISGSIASQNSPPSHLSSVVPQDGAVNVSSTPAVIKPEPDIVIPSGEDLASDQMDAIQALALLCGGGV